MFRLDADDREILTNLIMNVLSDPEIEYLHDNLLGSSYKDIDIQRKDLAINLDYCQVTLESICLDMGYSFTRLRNEYYNSNYNYNGGLYE